MNAATPYVSSGYRRVAKTLYISKKAIAKDHLLIYFLGSTKMTKKHLQPPSRQSPSSLSTLASARAAEATMVPLEPPKLPGSSWNPEDVWAGLLNRQHWVNAN